MKNLILVRNDKFGRLFSDWAELICYTIDPHVLTKGTYSLEMTYSPKFKRELPLIYNKDFSSNRGFRIHAGNTLKDSQGCILVGDAIDYNFALRDSRKALERVIRLIKDNDVRTLVIY